jgi:hypothetical protein
VNGAPSALNAQPRLLRRGSAPGRPDSHAAWRTRFSWIATGRHRGRIGHAASIVLNDSPDTIVATLRNAARRGQLHDFASGVADLDLDPAGGAAWPRERQVPAELLRTILLEPDLRPDPRGLRLRGAVITGILDLDHAVLPCPLMFIRSHFTQPPTLRYTTLPGLSLANCDLPGLDLDGARVDGAALLGGLTATGGVRALRAQITGQLGLQEATLTNEGGTALSLDGARVDGGAFLGGLTATGGVRAQGAQITGQLSLQKATLTNKGGTALNLDGARVDGGAFLRGLTATGEVHALRAQITGQLGLQEATLTNEGGTALSLDGARVDGGAFLGGLTATGEVHAQGAQITGHLGLQKATLTNKGDTALNLEQLTVRALLLQSLRSVHGGLNLTRSQIDDLIVDDSPVGGLPGPLVATGWQVKDMHGWLRRDRRTTATWLATQPIFVAQPWHALADVYERNGQPADARRLRLAAAHRTTKTAPRWSKPPRWAYGLLVGYGYYPLTAAMWLLAAFVLASALIASHTKTFVPTNPTTAATAVAHTTSTRAATTPATRTTPREPPTVTGATACTSLGDRYPCLRPLLLSLDVVLPPTVSAGQATAWRPTANWMTYLLTSLKTFGWLLTALLVAGVTGLLRKV